MSYPLFGVVKVELTKNFNFFSNLIISITESEGPTLFFVLDVVYAPLTNALNCEVLACPQRPWHRFEICFTLSKTLNREYLENGWAGWAQTMLLFLVSPRRIFWYVKLCGKKILESRHGGSMSKSDRTCQSSYLGHFNS